MAFHKVIAAAEIPLGDKRGVVIDGREVVVFHTEDGFHAFADRCPHLGAPLSEVGFVKGDEILCVLHCAKFALATGKVLASPAEEDLESFPCRVDRGVVWIELP